ncbi:hypothetical protein [Clostridium sp.]|uniref:pPIWI_RE_Z domain-containing protein n=1 Tax=Clostridium sp. TaxID=1506 RepID=UPI003D6C9236
MMNKIVKTFKQNIQIIEDWAANFAQIEILFYLSQKINETFSINDLYMLLGSRNIIVKNSEFNHNDFLISNAKNILKTMNQSKVYRDTLKKYMSDRYAEVRLYEMNNGRLIKKNSLPNQYTEREKDYELLLTTPIAGTKKTINYIDISNGDEYGYVNCINESKKINFPKDIQPLKKINRTNKIGGDILVTRKDLIATANKIDKTLKKTSDVYREKILTKNPILGVQQNKINSTNCIALSKITHMIGQVGSGKSTFAEAITVLLAEKNYRIVLIEPTVIESINKAKLLNNLGIKVVNVIGSSGRMRHINAASEDQDFLSEYYSEVLTPGCFVGALIDENDEAIKYGNEPCYKIQKFVGGKLSSNKNFLCPFFYKCPKSKVDKNLLSSQVIVTTIDGLCSTSMTAERELLFSHVLNNVDLVIIDEADNVLCRLDGIFAPGIGVNEYISLNTGIQLDYTNRDINQKFEAEEREFVETMNDLAKALAEIWNRIKEVKTGFSKTRLKKFTALQLLNLLNPDIEKHSELVTEAKLPKDIWKSLYNLMGNQLSDEENMLLSSAFNNEISFEYKLRLIKCNTNRFDTITERKVEFIIRLISFDQIYRKLSNLVRTNNNLPLSSKYILNQSFKEHQKWLPVAPVGNILGFETKDEDLFITKQFATGRALALKFPWLKLDKDGNALGPNVLLMSGTSFAPKSLMYHINSPVNYIIESEKHKREYISRSVFQYTQSSICVSGVDEEYKVNNIKKLLVESLEEIIDCLKNEDTILMIVNKYTQADLVATYLNTLLSTRGYEDIVTALKSDSDLSLGENRLKRSKVKLFNNKILVAPAVSVERGHNIVDEFGNSKFDTLMFLVRPMSDPTDYEQHVKKVNGYIMTKYSKEVPLDRLETYLKMRQDAFSLYNKLTSNKYGVSQLDKELQKDVTATLFVIIQQIFGRMNRMGDEVHMRSKPLKVYFLDGAFKAKHKNSYDFLNELILYLDELMSNKDYGNIARTLYEPFYIALKKGGNISNDKS